MTVYAFQRLSKREQLEIILTQGVHLFTRVIVHRFVTIYQIEAFYVEVFYSPTDADIKKVHSFLSTDQLEPYLKEMDLTEIQKLLQVS